MRQELPTRTKKRSDENKPNIRLIDLLRCARSCAISVLLDSMQLFQVRLRKKVKVKSVLFHGVRTWYYPLPSEQPTLFISFHRRRKIISRKYKEHASGHIRCRWPLWMRVAERRRLKMEPVLPPFQWTFLQRATFSESGDRFHHLQFTAIVLDLA